MKSEYRIAFVRSDMMDILCWVILSGWGFSVPCPVFSSICGL